jgi:hypothetical protein
MTRIRRGSVVYSVIDPRHDGIVRSLHLRKGKLFANVQWLETGWLSCRVPVAELRLVPANDYRRVVGWMPVARRAEPEEVD